jgi:hypothetical protein
MPLRIVEAATLVTRGSPPLTRSPVSTCRAHLPRWTGPGASVGCFPRPCCLPRSPAGSASMTSLSRPAHALHTLRPVDSLGRQKRPLSQGFDRDGYPSEPPDSYRANRPLPGWDLHPRGDRAVRGAPEDTEFFAGESLGSNHGREPRRPRNWLARSLGAKNSCVLRGPPCLLRAKIQARQRHEPSR